MSLDYRNEYVRIWRACLEAGYTTQDARDYAQLEIDNIRKQAINKPSFILDQEKDLPPNPPNAPKKIEQEGYITKSPLMPRSSVIPKFIKIPKSNKKKIKLEDKWAGTLNNI